MRVYYTHSNALVDVAGWREGRLFPPLLPVVTNVVSNNHPISLSLSLSPGEAVNGSSAPMGESLMMMMMMFITIYTGSH